MTACFDTKYETVVTIRNNDKKILIHEWKKNIIKFENRLGRICWNPEGLWSTRNLVDTAESTHNSHQFENLSLSKIISFISMKNRYICVIIQVYKLQCLISVLLPPEQLSLEEWVRWVKDIWYLFTKIPFQMLTSNWKKKWILNSKFKHQRSFVWPS